MKQKLQPSAFLWVLRHTCTLKNLSKVADNIVVDDDAGEITTNDDMSKFLYQNTISKMLNNIKKYL